jgi:hypothetical protein
MRIRHFVPRVMPRGARSVMRPGTTAATAAAARTIYMTTIWQQIAVTRSRRRTVRLPRGAGIDTAMRGLSMA